jgi:TonB-dependent SusC/RagA subfamily outer membrane receptor
MSPTPAAAQATGTVRGTVLETGTGRPLVGAQVSIRGTTRGSLTDASGNYIIPNVTVGSVTVRVESIGFKTLEQTATVSAGQAAVVNFELQQSAIGLDEIVVTGTVGRQTKRSIGNSVSTIKAADVTEVAPIQNVNQLLQGRSPGVNLLAASGVVGGSMTMRVRGASSLSAGNDPVVYLDGIRIQSGTTQTEGNTAQGVSLLETINPQDIESIEVIKGPAAATLYGAEAATGVIQIITKKGRPAEGLQWTLNAEYGQTEWVVDKITNYWLCPTAADNHPLNQLGVRMSNLNSNPGCAVFDPSQPLSERLLVDNPFDMSKRSEAVYQQLRDKGLPTDEFACLYPVQAPCNPVPLRTGDAWNTNLSVRGGGESYNFYLSGERNDEQGTFFNNFNRRSAGRANFGFVPSQKMNFLVNVGYSQVDQQIPQADNSSNSILRNAFRGQAGGPSSQYLPGYRNFMPEFSNKHNRKQRFERMTISATGNYNPWPWFQNRLIVGLDRNDRTETAANQIEFYRKPHLDRRLLRYRQRQPVGAMVFGILRRNADDQAERKGEWYQWPGPDCEQSEPGQRRGNA